MLNPKMFKTFFVGGFECSTQRRRDGRRLDLLQSTQHDRFAGLDYAALHGLGIRTVRDGVRWHLIERAPNEYDWSSFLPMLGAAKEAGVQVIWDLCHYGWPDHIDIWSGDFVDRFARFAARVAAIVHNESDAVPFYCPVNEISFWAWAAGDARTFEPVAKGCGGELKRQLVRASIAAIDAIRGVDPRARIVNADPLVNVMAGRSKDDDAAAQYHLAQYESRDMIVGRLAPELGGRPEYLDIVGVNFYPQNQWLLGGPTIEFGNSRYRPLRQLLSESYARYNRPHFLAETGAEGSARAAWLFYVCEEVQAAIGRGVPLHGICLYPITDYHGWENDRHCDVGLLGCADEQGHRVLYQPLARELARQQQLLAHAVIAESAATPRALAVP